MFFVLEKQSQRIVGMTENGQMSNFLKFMQEEYYTVPVDDYMKNIESTDELDRIDKVFQRAGLSYDIYGDKTISVEIIWGDWKHDHLFCDSLMEVLGYKHVNTKVTEEDGSDTYSAIREYEKVSKNRTYFTLRAKTDNLTRPEIMDIEFDTFEDAYHHMCLTYENEKNKGIPHKYWRIWETRVNGENEYSCMA